MYFNFDSTLISKGFIKFPNWDKLNQNAIAYKYVKDELIIRAYIHNDTHIHLQALNENGSLKYKEVKIGSPSSLGGYMSILKSKNWDDNNTNTPFCETK